MVAKQNAVLSSMLSNNTSQRLNMTVLFIDNLITMYWPIMNLIGCNKKITIDVLCMPVWTVSIHLLQGKAHVFQSKQNTPHSIISLQVHQKYVSEKCMDISKGYSKTLILMAYLTAWTPADQHIEGARTLA